MCDENATAVVCCLCGVRLTLKISGSCVNKKAESIYSTNESLIAVCVCVCVCVRVCIRLDSDL